MQIDEVKWNDAARAKILEDADRVFREAAQKVNSSMAGESYDDVYEALFGELKGQFIDFEPGPDLEAVAKAIEARQLS